MVDRGYASQLVTILGTATTIFFGGCSHSPEIQEPSLADRAVLRESVKEYIADSKSPYVSLASLETKLSLIDVSLNPSDINPENKDILLSDNFLRMIEKPTGVYFPSDNDRPIPPIKALQRAIGGFTELDEGSRDETDKPRLNAYTNFGYWKIKGHVKGIRGLSVTIETDF